MGKRPRVNAKAKNSLPYNTPTKASRSRGVNKNITSTSTANTNTFSILSDDEITDPESIKSQAKRSKNNATTNVNVKQSTASTNLLASQSPPENNHKPPPRNSVGVEYAKLVDLLKNAKLSIANYKISLSAFGIRVFSTNRDCYLLLKSALISSNVKFYTHQLRDEQTTKIVLQGLFRMEINELKDLLNEANVHPCDIKVMNIHQKRYEDHCLYLLYFLKNQKVKISNLREIPAINHVKVRWQYYSNSRVGPMQCSRCMKFGHGGNNCFLDPMCIRCGEKHLSNECPLLVDPETDMRRTRIPNDQLKCGNCGQNHSANSQQCEYRMQFVDRQQRFQNRIQRRQQHTANRQFIDAPQLNDFNFPRLNPRDRAEYREQHQTPANQFQQQNQWQQNHNDDLFTPNELKDIFVEICTRVSRASNKMEQLSILFDISTKYIGNGQY